MNQTQPGQPVDKRGEWEIVMYAPGALIIKEQGHVRTECFFDDLPEDFDFQAFYAKAKSMQS